MFLGQTPIESKNHVESIGMAVFKDDVLIGELNNIETLSHLIITNRLKNATVNIKNPFDNSNNISFYISENKKTKHKVSFVNGHPFIECEIWLTGNVPTMYDSINLSDENCMNVLNEELSSYIETQVSSYLYKTSKVYQSDIAGFGEYVKPKYLTWQEWIDSDWLRKLFKFIFWGNCSFKYSGWILVWKSLKGDVLYYEYNFYCFFCYSIYKNNKLWDFWNKNK